jgi:hypothetical protein
MTKYKPQSNRDDDEDDEKELHRVKEEDETTQTDPRMLSLGGVLCIQRSNTILYTLITTTMIGLYWFMLEHFTKNLNYDWVIAVYIFVVLVLGSCYFFIPWYIRNLEKRIANGNSTPMSRIMNYVANFLAEVGAKIKSDVTVVQVSGLDGPTLLQRLPPPGLVTGDSRGQAQLPRKNTKKPRTAVRQVPPPRLLPSPVPKQLPQQQQQPTVSITVQPPEESSFEQSTSEDQEESSSDEVPVRIATVPSSSSSNHAKKKASSSRSPPPLRTQFGPRHHQ